MDTFFSRLFTRKNRKQATRKTSAKKPKRDQLTLEALEARITPAVKFWNGSDGTGLWSHNANWAGGVAPINNDTIVFNTNLFTTVAHTTQSAASYNTIDDINNLIVDHIDFQSAAPGANNTFALGLAQSAASPFAYTISGNGTTGILTINPGVGVPAGTAADGIHIFGGVNTTNIANFTETFAATVPIKIIGFAAAQSAEINSADVNTQLTINGTIALNVPAAGDTLDVAVAGGVTNNATKPGVNLNGVVSGVGSLTKDGTGTLLLAAVNTYTGPLANFNQSINNGVVIVAQSNAGGSGLGANSGPGAADTIVNGQTPGTAGQIILANGVTVNQRLDLNSNATGGGLTTNGALATWSGPVQFDVTTTGGGAAAAPLGTVGAPLGDKLVISGVISGGDGTIPTVLTVQGNGTVDFANDNTYGGRTVVGTAGSSTTLLVDKGDGLGLGRVGGSDNSTTVTNGSSLIFTGNFAVQDTTPNPEDFTLNGAGVGNLGAMQVAALGTVVLPGNITLNGIVNIAVNSATGTLVHNGAMLNGAPNGELVKIGPGTMILANTTGTASNYAAGTEIRGGILRDSTASANTGLGAGNVQIDDNTTLQMGYSPGPTGISIANNIIFQGVNPAVGALGSLEQIASGVGAGIDDTITGNVQLLGNAASQVPIAVDTAPDRLIFFGNVITPTGPGTGGGFVLNNRLATGATPQPNGTLLLEPLVGSNTYGGVTTVDAGNLQLASLAAGQITVPGNLVVGDTLPNSPVTGLATDAFVTEFFNDNTIATTSNVTINPDGILNLNGFNQTINTLTMTGGAVAGGGGSTLTLTGDVTATAFIDARGPAAGPASIHSASISVANLALNATTGGNRTFTVNQPATLPLTDIADLTVLSALRDNTAGGGAPVSNLIKAGNGVMVLTGANAAFNGSTTVNAGALVAASATALGTGANDAVTQVSVASGATLAITASIAGHNLILNGPGFVDPVASAVAGVPVTSAALEGFGAAVHNWSGDVLLAANSTVGELSGGFLVLSNVIHGPGNLDVLGPTPFFGTGAVAMDATSQGANAVLAATPNSYGSAANNTTVEAGAHLILNKFNPLLGIGAALTAVPGALHIVGATPNFTGATNGIGANVPGGIVDVWRGALTGPNAGIEIGAVAANQPVTIDSGGTLNVGNLPGINAQLSIGALTFNVASATAAPTSPLTLIDIFSNAGAPGSQLQLTADVLVNGGIGGFAQILGTGAQVNQLLLSGTRTFNVLSASAGSTELDLDLAVGVGNAIAPAGNGAITKIGAGTLQMSGTAANTYGGATNINVGTLLLNKTGALANAGQSIPLNTILTVGTGAGSPTSVVVKEIGAGAPGNWQVGGIGSGGASIVVKSDGLFDLNGHMDRIGGATALDLQGGLFAMSGGTLFVEGTIKDSGAGAAILGSVGTAGVIDLANGVRNIDVVNGANLTIGSVIVDGGVNKIDGGQLILTAKNTYVQNTTILAGKLTVNGSLVSAVNILPPAGVTAILNGTGSVGPVTAGPTAGTAIEAPGNSPGTITVNGDDTFNTGSQYTVILGGVGGNTAFTHLEITGAANLGNGNAILNVTVPGSFAVGTQFDIIHAVNGVNGVFQALPNNTTFTTADGKLVTITYGPNDVFLTLQSPQTSTSVVGNPNPVVFGHSVTFTATITDLNPAQGPPTGSVEFFDGMVDLGPGTALSPSGSTATSTFTTTTLPSGPQNIIAKFTGSGNFQNSQGSVTEDVLAVTATSVASSVNPSNVGQAVTFTATITNTSSNTTAPTGSVEFFNGLVDLGPGTALAVGGNTATSTFTTSTLPSGVDTIIAKYTHTGDFVDSQGQISQTVNAADTVAVSGNPNPVVFGHAVTLTATITNTSGAATPQGTVEFFDGNVDLGAGSALSGAGNTATSTFTTTNLASGPRTIKAVYTAAPGFQSGSGQFIEDVQAVTSSSLSSSQNPSNFGQSVTFTDVITNTSGSASPTGSVTFTSGALTFTTSSLVVGGNTVTATWTTSALPSGVDNVVATYNPTGDFVTSTASLNQTVNAADTVTVSGNPNPVVFGHAVTLTATITNTSGAATPQGTVEFFDGNTDLGSGTALSGAGNTATSTFTTTNLASGPRTIKAVYTASAGFQSGSGQFIEDVQAVTTTGVASSLNPSNAGQSVTFTATVTNTSGMASPTGAVEFFNGVIDLGPGTALTVGGSTVTSTFTTSTLPAGVDNIIAKYTATGDFVSSQGSISQTVNALTTTTASGNPNPSMFGNSVTLTATVTDTSGAATPTGSVEFFNGNVDLGPGSALSGAGASATSTFTTTALPAGADNIKAVYTPSGAFVGSSGTFTQNVQAGSTTTVASNNNPSTQGNPVTFTATIVNNSSGATPTGTVEFSVNGTPTFGPVTVSGTGNSATATWTTSSLAVGSDTITAAYTATGSFQSSSGTVQQTVVAVSFPPPPVVLTAAVLKGNGELDLLNSQTGAVTTISPAGTIASIATALNPSGLTVVFAIVSGTDGTGNLHTLWEYSPTSPTTGTWSEISTGSFGQISGADSASANPVVFGVLDSGAGNYANSLWEFNGAWNQLAGFGVAGLQPGLVTAVSAVSTTSGEVAYVITQNGSNVWEHAFGTGPSAAWSEISSGSFLSISGGFNGFGQPTVYGIVLGGTLWEQNPKNGTGLNIGWTELSGTPLVGGNGTGPTTFLSVAAGGPDTAFAIASDQTLWQHSNAGWSQTSVGHFAQVSAAETKAGADLVFAALSDGEFWDFNSSRVPQWEQVFQNGVPFAGAASTSAPA